MNPFRPVIVDNRPPVAQFIDGNPMTDGLANLFASAINAPIAAGQIRRQRELDDQAMARQNMLDQRAQDWRDQDVQRQTRRDDMAQVWQDAQIGNMQADNARQLAAMFGNGINNAAARWIDAVKAMRGLFGGWGRGTGTKTAGPQKPVINNFGTDAEPNWRQWNGQAWVPAIPPVTAEAAAAEPEAQGDAGWPLLPTLGAGAAGGAGVLALGKKLLTRGAPAAPAGGAAPGAMARLWSAAGRGLPVLGSAIGAGTSIYDAATAEDAAGAVGGGMAAGGFLGTGAASLAGKIPLRAAGLAAAPILMAQQVRSAVESDAAELDPGAAAVIRGYATGERIPRQGMIARGMQILGTGDSTSPDQIQQRRVQQILHAVNVALPPATDAQQQAKRQMLLGRIEQAAWSDDPSELQAQLSALFPTLVQR